MTHSAILTAEATGYGPSIYGSRRERMLAEEEESARRENEIERIAVELWDDYAESKRDYPVLFFAEIMAGKDSAIFERTLMREAREIYEI